MIIKKTQILLFCKILYRLQTAAVQTQMSVLICVCFDVFCCSDAMHLSVWDILLDYRIFKEQNREILLCRSWMNKRKILKNHE